MKILVLILYLAFVEVVAVQRRRLTKSLAVLVISRGCGRYRRH